MAISSKGVRAIVVNSLRDEKPCAAFSTNGSGLVFFFLGEGSAGFDFKNLPGKKKEQQQPEG